MACVHIRTERTADQFALAAGHAERAGGAPCGGRLSYCFRHGANAIDAFTAITYNVIYSAGEFENTFLLCHDYLFLLQFKLNRGVIAGKGFEDNEM
jgi:hypothetical protein